MSTKKLLGKILKLLESPFIGGLVLGLILLFIEFKAGIFETNNPESDNFISPLWSGLAASVTMAVFISFANFLRVLLGPQEYFREDFSRASLSTFLWLVLASIISLIGGLMFWHPIVSVSYIVSNRELIILRPSWEGYAFLLTSIIIFYSFISARHQNWSGLKSTQQHDLEQKSEEVNILLEGLGEFKRALVTRNGLEKYVELDPNNLLGRLEQSEDLISQAWKEQAWELLRLSSSSYAVDSDSGWHDKQGCWIGENIDTGSFFFLYPALTDLNHTDINNFMSYAQKISKSQKRSVSEFIIAFRNTQDKLNTPTDAYQNIIRFETEDNLLEDLVNFTDYLNNIKKRVLSHTLLESDLTLNEVYVPSNIFSEEKDIQHDDVELYLREWLQEPSQRQIALLGEYGQGKSSTALMFTYHLLCEADSLPKRIPILIELRGKSPRDLTPLELLGAWASQYRIEPQALMRLHIAGRLVLIFDGFDEMTLIGNSEFRRRHFRALWQFCYRNAETKILITGRPNFFLDDTEMKTALGISKPIGNEAYCEAIRLAPFNISQIHSALRQHKPSVQSQIHSLARSEERFWDLVSRPSLLHIVSVLWEKEQLYQKTQLLNSAYVMERFVRNSYRREGVKPHGNRRDSSMALNSSERDYFMCGIASYMAANQLSNQIHNEQLNELINNLISAIPDSVSTSAPDILGEDTRPLKLRIKEDSKDETEHIRTDVRTCGLLVDDLSAPGSFKFGHKSFMEYLFSLTVKEYIWDNNSNKANAIKKVTQFPIEALLDLPVSIGFLAEMIGTDSKTRNLTDSENNKNPLKKRIKVEFSIAKRLLKVIFKSREYTPDFLILRLILFTSTFILSGVQNRFSHQKSAKFERVLRRFILFVLIALGAFQLSPASFREELLPDFIFRDIIVYLISILLFSIAFAWSLSIFLVVNKNKASSISRKFILWNSICKELNIRSEVLHRISGTFFLPWTSKQPFEYFLKKSNLITTAFSSLPRYSNSNE